MSDKFTAVEILNRIKYELRTDSWARVAEALGKAGPSSITNWIRRNTLDLQSVYDFAVKHDLNMHWLLTGEGPESAWAVRQMIPEKVLKEFQMIAAFVAACQVINYDLMYAISLEMTKEIGAVLKQKESKQPENLDNSGVKII